MSTTHGTGAVGPASVRTASSSDGDSSRSNTLSPTYACGKSGSP